MSSQPLLPLLGLLAMHSASAAATAAAAAALVVVAAAAAAGVRQLSSLLAMLLLFELMLRSSRRELPPHVVAVGVPAVLGVPDVVAESLLCGSGVWEGKRGLFPAWTAGWLEGAEGNREAFRTRLGALRLAAGRG